MATYDNNLKLMSNGPEIFQQGARIGPYSIISLLGKGGMGAVYLAEQTSLQRQIALKVLHSDRNNDQKQLDQFIAEARIAARLDHPNLLAIHDAGFDDIHQAAYFSMERIDGSTLRQRVNKEGPMDSDLARHLISQAAEGLACAHEQGVIHRDIKPDNIMVTPKNTVKVADLGLAVTLDRGGRSKSKRRRLVLVGTLGWSAPEQMRDPSLASPASDVFSLGCCYYFLLTGHDPYDGDGLIDLAVKMHTEFPLLFDELSPEDQQIVETLLHPEAEQRPQNGHEAVQFIQEMSAAAAEDARPKARRRRRRRR